MSLFWGTKERGGLRKELSPQPGLGKEGIIVRREAQTDQCSPVVNNKEYHFLGENSHSLPCGISSISFQLHLPA